MSVCSLPGQEPENQTSNQCTDGMNVGSRDGLGIQVRTTTENHQPGIKYPI